MDLGETVFSLDGNDIRSLQLLCLQLPHAAKTEREGRPRCQGEDHRANTKDGYPRENDDSQILERLDMI